MGACSKWCYQIRSAQNTAIHRRLYRVHQCYRNLCTRPGHMATILCTISQQVQKQGRLCASCKVKREANVKQEANGEAATEKLDFKLKMCCYLGSATEHAICTCDLATALCREKHVNTVFHLPCSAKQWLRIMLHLNNVFVQCFAIFTTSYLFGVHAQVSYY